MKTNPITVPVTIKITPNDLTDLLEAKGWIPTEEKAVWENSNSNSDNVRYKSEHGVIAYPKEITSENAKEASAIIAGNLKWLETLYRTDLFENVEDIVIRGLNLGKA